MVWEGPYGNIRTRGRDSLLPTPYSPGSGEWGVGSPPPFPSESVRIISPYGKSHYGKTTCRSKKMSSSDQ